MNEYELLVRLINPKYRAINQNVLKENKSKKPHKAELNDTGIDDYTLYRFDIEENSSFLDFLHNSSSLKNLLCFCDYVLFAEKNENLFVVLIEMKSGLNNENAKAHEQISAARTFVNYLVETAKRISIENKYLSFNPKNIRYREIIVKQSKSHRPPTNIFKSSQIEWSSETAIIWSESIPLLQICNNKFKR